MKLTNSNYYTPEANQEYFSVSQFKAFERCEAAALAELQGRFIPSKTSALLIGSYVDAYFSDELDEFVENNPELFNKRSGELKAEFKHANDLINIIECQPLMVEYLTGEKQRIFTGELYGVKWKIKTDVFNPAFIADLKVVKDFNNIYEKGAGWKDFIEFWGYDLQAALYTRIEQINSGRSERLPFFIVAVTKETTPAFNVYEIEEPEQSAAIRAHGVESKIQRFDLIKRGLVPPTRCENCEYCRKTRILTKPTKYRIERINNGQINT